MKWLVLEDNLVTDNYVPVVQTHAARRLVIEQRRHASFSCPEEAFRYARSIGERYGVKAILVFRTDNGDIDTID